MCTFVVVAWQNIEKFKWKEYLLNPLQSFSFATNLICKEINSIWVIKMHLAQNVELFQFGKVISLNWLTQKC